MSRCPTWLSPATVFLTALMLQVHWGVFVEGQAVNAGKCPTSDYGGESSGHGRFCNNDAGCVNGMKCCLDSATNLKRCKFPEAVICPPLSYYYGQVKSCRTNGDCTNTNQMCCPHYTGQTVCKYGI